MHYMVVNPFDILTVPMHICCIKNFSDQICVVLNFYIQVRKTEACPVIPLFIKVQIVLY